MDLGSCREVIEDGVSGFLVSNTDEAVAAVERVHEIDPSECRYRVEKHFSIRTMIEGYEEVYRKIFSQTAEDPD